MPKQGVDPAPQRTRHGTGPGDAVRVAQGEGEELSCVGRQVKDHRSLEVVGEHDPGLVDERTGNDEIPGTVGIVKELLEARMTERILLGCLDRLPALRDAC